MEGWAEATSVELLDWLLRSGDAAGADRLAIATRHADGWKESTYASLDRRSRAVASRLADLGTGPGDRVALFGESGGDWTAAFLGILRRGAIAVTLDPKLGAAELAALCGRSRLAAAIVAPVLADRWSDPAPRIDLSAPLAPPTSDGSNVIRALTDPAVLVWTSGTTGRPRGVTLSFANIAYVVTQSTTIQGTGPDARWLSVLPPNHLLELCCGLLPALAVGSATFVANSIVPSELVAMMAYHRVNQMVVVPLVLRLLKRHIEVTGDTLGTLASCYCGGAPLAPELADFFEGLGVGVYQGYGLTEASPVVAMNVPGANRTGSVGRPLPGTAVRIADGGEILVRGPGVMSCYWDDAPATREAIDQDGWLHTGDLGRVDGDGYLYVTGRAKSLIVLETGENVQPEEVETALDRGEVFAEACVVGLPTRRGAGEQVCAVVVPSTPMSQEDAEQAVRHLTAGLSPFKQPTAVRLHDGELPKTVKRTFRRADVLRTLQTAETRA